MWVEVDILGCIGVLAKIIVAKKDTLQMPPIKLSCWLPNPIFQYTPQLQ